MADTTPRCENGHRNPFGTPCQAGSKGGSGSGQSSQSGSTSKGNGK